jgi:hypothetical protein
VGFFKKLSNIFSPSQPLNSWEYWINVKCNRCGEIIRVRVDLRNDLSIDYGISDDQEGGDTQAGGAGDVTYFCRKVIIGEQRCYQPIEVVLKFDQKHRMTDRQIKGGQFVDGNVAGKE